MRKYRYTVFNCVLKYYQNKHTDYNTLIKESGYDRLPPHYYRSWDVDKITQLEKQGYTHNLDATSITLGDNDYLVIDHVRKEFCFWENGFYPFIGNYRNFPQDESLYHYAITRR